MASEQWLLNDTSVASGAYFTAVGSSYKLKNNNQTLSRTTSSPTPYEGAGCYLFTTNNIIREIQTSANGAVNGAKFVDYYVYVPTGLDVVDYQFMLCANDGAVEYSWAAFFEDGSIGFGSYDNVNGLVVTRVSSAGAITVGAWNRLAAKSDTYGILELKAFRGSNINGSTADTTITSASYSSYGFSTYVLLGVNGGPGVTFFPYADDIKFDTAAYPTRGGTAHTAAGTATATASGTAAMSNARTLQATATGTATGTAAASNQRTLAASATATATGTAAMSNARTLQASATGTATGTAAADVTSLVTITAAATVTASGTASMLSTQAMSASATITATGTAVGSIRPFVTVDGAGTVTATGTTTFNKSQTLAASASATASATASLIAVTTIAAAATSTATATATLLITTPGSLYGNATKVAGLYGSSTKPTLTTRS